MGLFDRIKNLARTLIKRSDYARVGHSSRTMAGVAITPDTAVTISAVWACLRYLSQTVAGLPWHVMRDGESGAEIVSRNTPDYLIYRRPNKEWSSFQFRETMTHWALRWGNAFAEIERDQMGRPFALWPIHPERVLVCRDPESGEIFYEVTGQNGGKIEIAAADMFHIRGFGEGVVGVNVIDYAAQSLGWARAAQLFGATFFGNGANVSGMVVHKKKLTDSGLRRVKAEFDQLFKGIKNSHGVVHTDTDADFKKFGLNAKETQLVEVHHFLIEEVCRWFGVPPHKVAHLLRATFCLPADAKVFTESGPKRIADTKVGERVWSRDRRGAWVLSSVEKSARTGIDRILRIATTNRTLRLNSKHRVLVRRAHEVPLAAGQIGGRNVGGRKVRIEWRTEYMPAGDLRLGDTVVTLDRLPDLGGGYAPNGRVLSCGFMAFCGLLLGDGNVFAGSISIARAATAPYMDYYRDVAVAEFDAAANRGGYAGVAGERRPVLLREADRQTRFSSVAAAHELKALGFSGVARTKRVPGWVYGLSEDLRLAFLAGFLDADGSVDKKGRMAFHSVSADLLDDVRHLCIGLGIPVTNARRAKIKTTLPNGKSFEGEISTFTCSDPGENRRVPTVTPIYVERMNAGQPFDRKGRAYPRFGGAGFDEVGCGLSRIVSIDVEAAEPVYDLTVSGTHNFVADGVVVHNSNIEHQAIEVVVDSVMPWVQRFEDEANFKLFGEANRLNLYTKMNLRGLLRGDFKSQNEGLEVARRNGVVDANEWRDFIGMNKMKSGKGGDKFVMQSQFTTLDKIGEVVTQPSAPSQPSTPPAEKAAQNRLLALADMETETV